MRCAVLSCRLQPLTAPGLALPVSAATPVWLWPQVDDVRVRDLEVPERPGAPDFLVAHKCKQDADFWRLLDKWPLLPVD